MRAIHATTDALDWHEVPTPEPGPGEVRIRVRATAVNRADLMQRAGLYPPPPGASDILGLEAAGIIDSLGPGVDGWSAGDAVCALLAGGGYAEQVVCPAAHLLPVPRGLDLVQAAALPEVFATARLNLWMEAALQPGERVLLHAGGSGVGTAAIQLCQALGNPCFVTAGSAGKIARCIELGAEGGANRHERPWPEVVRAWGRVDVILDPVGAGYLEQDLEVLGTRGRIVIIGLMGGRMAQLDLGRLLVKRLRIVGSTLRSRSHDEKAAIIEDLRANVWPLIESGAVKPIIDRVMPITEAAAAFEVVAADETFGKIVLTIGSA